MKDLSKVSTVELLSRITTLDQQIDLKIIQEEKLSKRLYDLKQEIATLIPEYENVRIELINRFPILEKDKEFQPKIKRK